jgi:hypothetical protein
MRTLSEDPYRQLAGGVRCDCCGAKMTGDRRAFFRFDGTGTRRWCCGGTECLQRFFAGTKRKAPVFQVVDRTVTRADSQ